MTPRVVMDSGPMALLESIYLGEKRVLLEGQ